MTASRGIISVLAIVAVALSSLMLAPATGSAQEGWPVQVATNKDVYISGETVRITVTVVGPYSASFSSTCQSFFVVEDASGNVVYDLRDHSYWYWILTDLYVPSGSTEVFQFTWNQRDDANNQVPVPASYVIWGYIAGWNIDDPPRAGDSKQISVEEPPPVLELIVTRQDTGGPKGDAASLEFTSSVTGSMTLIVEDHGLSAVQVEVCANTSSGLVPLYSERVSFGGDKYSTKSTGAIQVTGGSAYLVVAYPVGKSGGYAVIRPVFGSAAP